MFKFKLAPTAIPDDVVEEVIGHFSGDKSALAVCALARRSWLPYARVHQFRTITVPSTSESSIPRSIIARVAQYATYIRFIQLTLKWCPSHRVLRPLFVDFYAGLCHLAPFLSHRLRGLIISSATFGHLRPFETLSPVHRRSLASLFAKITEVHLMYGQMSSAGVYSLLSLLPHLNILSFDSMVWKDIDTASIENIIKAFSGPLASLSWTGQFTSGHIILVALAQSASADSITSVTFTYDLTVQNDLGHMLKAFRSLHHLSLELFTTVPYGMPLSHPSLRSLEIVIDHYVACDTNAVFLNMHLPQLAELTMTIDMVTWKIPKADGLLTFDSFNPRQFPMLSVFNIRMKVLRDTDEEEVRTSAAFARLVQPLRKVAPGILHFEFFHLWPKRHV